MHIVSLLFFDYSYDRYCDGPWKSVQCTWQSEPGPASLAIFEPLWLPTVLHGYMRSHSFDWQVTIACTTILQPKKKRKKKQKRPDCVSHCRGHETSRTRFWVWY